MSIRRSNHDMRAARTGGKLLTRAVGALLAAGLLCGTVTASVASAEETLQNPEISQGGVSGTVGNADGAGISNETTSNDASAEDMSTDSQAASVPDHTVEGLSPDGTTIDMFDYWITQRDAPDYNNGDATTGSTGINAGHSLHFTTGPDNETDANKWTGSADTRSGLVRSSLSNGYPVLSGQHGTTENESLAYLFNESLQSGKQSFPNVQGMLQLDKDGYYYYDSQQNFASLGEQSRQMTLYDNWGVKAGGQSPDGQFFPFNTANQVFKKNSDGSFETDSSGKLVPEDVNSRCSTKNEADKCNTVDINHYFGVHMSSEFVQPTGGYVDNAKTKPMTYEFSGDDDVWVYIDGMLVGDLGGIHNAGSLKIDFHTGEVVVNEDKYVIERVRVESPYGWPGGEYSNCEAIDGYRGWYYCDQQKNIERSTTLKQLFKLPENTFTDGSYHTLDFFYLERGNSDSNMKLKFNLVAPKSSDVIKVDQNGDMLEGAQFALYFTGADHQVGTDSAPLATGETDSNGRLVLQYAEGNPDGEMPGSMLDFHKRWGSDKDTVTHANSTYYVLKETAAPVGYSRMINPMELKYMSAKDSTSGSLTSDPTSSSPDSSIWKTGGIARGKETLTAPSEFKTNDGDCSTVSCETADKVGGQNGTMFAVVLRKADDNTWQTITGNTVDGWNAQDATDIDSIIKAHQVNPHDFRLNGGEYKADIDELPGYLNEYYYQISDDADKANAKYTVAVYYSTAAEASNMTASNTWRVTGNSLDDFGRTFSSRFYVPNIKNELYVQKVDEDGNPIKDGVATFKLYKAGEVDATADTTNGGYVIDVHDGAAPDSVTTQNAWLNDNDPGTPSFANAAAFGLASTVNGTKQVGFSGNPLTNGTYYLVEETAPDGYVKHANATKIIVNDSGIYADAGNENDGIKVVRGVGQLVATMSTFGSTGSFDDTLRYIKTYPGAITVDENDGTDNGASAALYPGKVEKQSGTVKAADTESSEPLQLQYGGVGGNSGAALDYGPRDANGNYLFVADEGWPILRTYQDSHPEGAETLERTTLNNSGANTNPTNSDGSLSSLITGSVMVQVTNRKAAATATISLNKQVKGGDWNPADHGNKNFEFTLQRVTSETDDTPVSNGDVTATVTGSDGKSTVQNVGSLSAHTTGTIQTGESNKQLVKGGKANGFPVLSFAKENTYYFRLSEKTDGAPDDWTYDTHVVKIVVTVSKGDDGSMTAEVKYDGTIDAPLFVNTKYGPELPETGGNGPMALVWGGLLLAGCGLAGLGYARRRW